MAAQTYTWKGNPFMLHYGGDIAHYRASVPLSAMAPCAYDSDSGCNNICIDMPIMEGMTELGSNDAPDHSSIGLLSYG